MKTIGIITIHRIYNYGSVLQAFALQQVCKKIGYHTEIIDYKFPNEFHIAKSSTKKPSVSLFGKVKSFIMKVLFARSLLRQHHSIDQFVATHLNLSEMCFKTPEQLAKYPPEYDIYITGSDQVWNHNHCFGDVSFFLGFAGGQLKKISYASSFGTKEIDDCFKKPYADLLSRYSHLSVREISGVSIIRELTGKKAQLVLDPTLLLTPAEWNDIAKTPREKGKYILCYYLNYSFDPFPYADHLAQHIRRITGYRIVRVGRPPEAFRNPHTVNMVGASPEEFVGLIRDAAIVLTTSFHGTAFALNFGIPVFTIVENRSSSDSRQVSLMESVGLGNRILSMGDEYPTKDKLPCDYLKPHERLSTLRESSFSYLISALQDE